MSTSHMDADRATHQLGNCLIKQVGVGGKRSHKTARLPLEDDL